MAECQTCGKLMTHPERQNCGGDCRMCMATVFGDPDESERLVKIIDDIRARLTVFEKLPVEKLSENG